MEIKFSSTYSKSTRKHWEHLLLDYPNAFTTTHSYNIVKGTVGYCYDYDLSQLRTYNTKAKTFVDLKAIGKYHKVEKFDIQHLPITTRHHIKQKIYGEVYYLSKNSGKQFIISEPDKLNSKRIKELKVNMNIRYLIDKHCIGNTTLEIIYSNGEYYLTNVCTPEKILDWEKVAAIGEYFNIKTPRLLSSKLLQYDHKLMDYFYSGYHFDDADYIPTKEYIIMFEFRGNKYLFCKI